MVKAMIDISEDANAVLNIVKAKYRLQDKSEAIEKVAEEYEQYLLEIRPKFIENLRKITQEPYKEYSSSQEAFEILRTTLKKDDEDHQKTRRKKSKSALQKNARSREITREI